MDTAVVMSTILGVVSVLLGLNVFFLRNLISKIENSYLLSQNSATRVEYLEKQMDEITTMGKDIAVLKMKVELAVDRFMKSS